MKRKKAQIYLTWQCRCGIKYSVLKRDPNAGVLPDRFKCWSPLGCRYYFQRNDELSPGSVVPALTIWQIINGMGTEVERQCGPAEINKLMVGAKIAAVTLQPSSDKRRSLILNITLESGKMIHLAPSVQGVTVYKVTQ